MLRSMMDGVAGRHGSFQEVAVQQECKVWRFFAVYL